MVLWHRLMRFSFPSFNKPKPMAFSSKKWWTTQDVAVVTGGNKGIGLEIGRNLSREGLTTVITARKEADGLNAVKELGEKHIDEDMHGP